MTLWYRESRIYAHAYRQLIPLQAQKKWAELKDCLFVTSSVSRQSKLQDTEVVRGQCLQLRLVTCGGIKMSAEAVKVIVRCRPMNDREKRLDCKVRLFSGRTYSAHGTSWNWKRAPAAYSSTGQTFALKAGVWLMTLYYTSRHPYIFHGVHDCLKTDVAQDVYL